MYIMVIYAYMYIAPGWGQMNLWGPGVVFFRINNIQSNSFSHSNA